MARMTVAILDDRVTALEMAATAFEAAYKAADKRVSQLERDAQSLDAVSRAQEIYIASLAKQLGALVTPAPPATQDPNDPALFLMPDGNMRDPVFRDYLISLSFQLTRHRTPNDGDWTYWRLMWSSLVDRGIELRMFDYAWKRLIGWGAGYEDRPPYGPYRQAIFKDQMS